MFGLFRQPQPAFGLDVSGSSFKIFQLDFGKKNVGVKCYSDIPVPKGLIVNDEIVDNKTFVYLLKENLTKPQYGRLTTNYAVVSLPESKSFVRVIQMPLMSESEAESAVPFEAESFIPLPVDQVYLDWQKLGDDGDKMEILIIASPREYVDKYLKLLDEAGIKTVALEVESQSCHRALIEAQSGETALIVDIDAYRSSLMMVEQGNLQFTSTIPIAGGTFTESIARALGISSSKAEEIKKKVGIANTPEYPNVKTAILPVLNNLTEEIKNILKFHNEHSGSQVQRLLLAGGGAKMKNLAEFVGTELASVAPMKVELANPWVNLKGLNNPPLNEVEALSFITAIGLAMRGLNL